MPQQMRSMVYEVRGARDLLDLVDMIREVTEWNQARQIN